MSTEEAVKRLGETHLEVDATVLSGYATDPMTDDFRRYGLSAFVAKPYVVEELGGALHKVVARTGR